MVPKEVACALGGAEDGAELELLRADGAAEDGVALEDLGAGAAQHAADALSRGKGGIAEGFDAWPEDGGD